MIILSERRMTEWKSKHIWVDIRMYTTSHEHIYQHNMSSNEGLDEFVCMMNERVKKNDNLNTFVSDYPNYFKMNEIDHYQWIFFPSTPTALCYLNESSNQ